MAALDKYHNTVKKALTRDDWDVTDPFNIEFGGIDYVIDFAAEK